MTEDADCPNCGHSVVVFHAGEPGGQVPPCFAPVDPEDAPAGYVETPGERRVRIEDGEVVVDEEGPPDILCACSGTHKGGEGMENLGEWMSEEELEEFWDQ